MGQLYSLSPLDDQIVSVPKEVKKAQIDYETISTRFSIHNNEELQQGINHLNEHGYAVFGNMLTNDQIKNSIDLFWEYLESLGEPFHIRRNDPQSWNKQWPDASDVGLLNYAGMGQSKFMWSIRGNPNIKKVFSQIWDSNELFVSFDGAGCFRNWHFNPDWKTEISWYHCDQNPCRKPNRCSIQGLVSLLDSDELTGGFVVVPDSHKHFRELQSIPGVDRRKYDLVYISDEYPLLQQFRPRLIKCKAGDLIVWDSRSIHCNTPSIISKDYANPPEMLRIVAYVCMSPSSMFVPKMHEYTNLEEFRHLREEFVRKRITCNHWPLELVGNGFLDDSSCEQIPLKLNAFQHSLIVGKDVQYDSEAPDILM